MAYCSAVTVLAIDGLAKRYFGHYAILKILSLRSPSSNSTSNLSLRIFHISMASVSVDYHD